MTKAPRNRKLVKTVKELVFRNRIAEVPRVMLVGPRGEIREVFEPEDWADFILRRSILLVTHELSAVIYLSVATLDDFLQISIIEFLDRDPRTAHLLLTQSSGQSWLEFSEEEFNKWFLTLVPKGG